tara:strand:+ start:16502 stop:18511 length:2010 start_codon:yes stop_codon:yes gene_type:complete
MISLSQIYLFPILLSVLTTVLVIKLELIKYIKFLPFSDLLTYYFLTIAFFLITIKFKKYKISKSLVLLFYLLFMCLGLGYLTISNSFTFFPSVEIREIILSLIFTIFLFLYIKYRFLNKKLELLLIFFGTFYLTFIILGFMTFTDYSTYINENFQNLSSVFLPIINLFYGSYAPIDTQSFYGYYPYFLLPFFSILELNLTSISLIFSFIFILCLISIYIFTYHYSKKHLLSFIVLLSSFFLVTSFANVWPGDLYLQYRPIRMLSPCIALLLFIYYDGNSSLHRYFLSIIVLSILTIWNFDSGFPTVLAFFASGLIISFFQNPELNILKRFLKILKLVSLTIIIFIIVWFLFFWFLYLITGEIISFKSLVEPFIVWRGTELFSEKFPQPIIVTIFLSSFYFLKSFHNIFINKSDRHYRPILFVSLLLLGLITYGSQNPHTAALSSYLLPVLLILQIINNKKNKFSINNLCILFLLSLLFILFVFNSKTHSGIKSIPTFFEIINPSKTNNKGLWYEKDLESGGTKMIKVSQLVGNNLIDPPWRKKAKWIEQVLDKNEINPSDKIFIASEADHLLYMALKKSNPVNMVNWHHVSHFKRWDNIYNMIKSTSVRAIIIDETYFLKNADLSGGDNYKHFEYLLSLKYKRIAKKSIGFAWYHPEWKPSNVEIWISD